MNIIITDLLAAGVGAFFWWWVTESTIRCIKH